MVALALAITSAHCLPALAQEKTLNIASWAGYVGKNTIPSFEKENRDIA